MIFFEIRQGTTEDAPGICAAHIASIRALNAPYYRPEQIEAWAGPKRPQDYLETMAKGTHYFVAVLEEVMVGFSSVHDAMLTGLYLAPQIVGQGLGKALCSRAEDWARSQGQRELFCEASLQAEGFYRHQGYVELERAICPLRGGQVGLEAVKMRKTL